MAIRDRYSRCAYARQARSAHAHKDALGSHKADFQSILDRLDVLSPSEGLITVLHIGSARSVPLNRKVRDEGVGSTLVEEAYFYVFAPRTFIAA